jgi:Site-specific recombinases, DNA invertase Pin homologs
MQKFRAIIYLRLSYSKDDLNESDSITNQRRIINDYIERHPEIEVVGEKVDDGISGIIFDRPAFKEMLELIEQGEVNCVIVKDLSRFGRDYIETGRYLQRVFPLSGVRFIAINDNIDTLHENSMDSMSLSIRSFFNDKYSGDISVKTRSALAAKREHGDYVGACPIYGYKKADDNNNQLVVDENAAVVVRDIFRMKIEGMSASKIAESLNKLGVLSPMEYKRENGLSHPKGGYADKADCKWSATTIIRILKDETYTGTLIQGRTTTPNYKIKTVVACPKSEWLRTENAHEAIVSKQDFDLVGRLMNLDTRTAPSGDKVYLFSGILICGCCGNRMTRKTVPYKGKSYFYYHCPTGKKNGCNAPMIKEEKLIDCVLETLKAHIRGIVSLDSLMKSCDTSVINQKLIEQNTVQLEQNNQKIAKNKQYKSKLYENMVSGILSKSEYTALKAKYDSTIKLLTDAVSVLESENDALLNNTSERLKWMEQFAHFENLSELDRKAVILLIQSISIHSKSEIEIAFNFQSEYEQAMSLMDLREVA